METKDCHTCVHYPVCEAFRNLRVNSNWLLIAPLLEDKITPEANLFALAEICRHYQVKNK